MKHTKTKEKIGFIGAGNLSQALIKSLINAEIFSADQIFVSNRSQGKLIKLKDQLNIHVCSSNESLVESVDIVVIAVKPQDFLDAIEPITQNFNENQIVISLAAGIKTETLQKYLPYCQIIRLIPNSPTLICSGVVGYYISNKKNPYLDTIINKIFSDLALVIKVETEDELEALMISTSCGPGFIFELMSYWSDWIEERGFSPEMAKKMTIHTFLGSAQLAKKFESTNLEDLQNRVTSKKGVTVAGLNSIRELEIERALRISFEKAALRNQEIEKSVN